ncbi:hypothetical protein Droror1_Dr00013172 [Drosera rotundifolia]
MRDDDEPCCTPVFWVYLIAAILLVSFAGLMSGLSSGFMSFSIVDLEVLAVAGHPEEKKRAEKILPIAKNQHLLLCSLLIYKTIALEALPIFLDAILPAWSAILLSVALVLTFSEILPHSFCCRHGLSVVANLSLFVRLLVEVLRPISYPITKLLDWLLGNPHGSALMRRSELKALVDLHGNEAGKGGELTNDETSIIGGALELTEKTAKDAMTPLSKVFSLDIRAKLDKDTMELIMKKGHSRVPIYSGSPANIIGIILVKSMVFYRPEDETPIRNLDIRRISRFHDHQPLYDILNQFREGHSHMGLVVKSKLDGNCAQLPANVHPEAPPGSDPTSKQSGGEEVIGIITMEDVLEELIQEEILDETDILGDFHRIRIIASPFRRSFFSTGSSPASDSHQSWRSTPVASPRSTYRVSPLKPYYQSSLLRSPAPPYVPSPLIRPTLLSSPARSVFSSPATDARTMHNGPFSQNEVSRKSNEKLHRLGVP